MAGIYVYRDRWARTKEMFGLMTTFFGVCFFLPSIMGHTGTDELAHVPFWAGPLVSAWGLCMVSEAKARAYSTNSKFSAKKYGILMIVIQVLVLAEVVIHKAFDLKSLLLSLVPALFAFLFLYPGCKRKSRAVAWAMVAYAAVILLANLNSLLTQIPGPGAFHALKAAALLLFALKLVRRRKKYLSASEEAEFI